MNKVLVSAALAVASVATPAAATQVIGSYDFNGTQFTQVGTGATGAIGPSNAFTGSFSYTFDTTTHTFALTGFTGDVGSQHFDLCNTGFSYDGNSALSIGATAGGIANYFTFPSDFVFNLLLDRATGDITSGGQLIYATTQPTNGVWQANHLSLETPAAVPEPATWAMMLLGFGGIGMAMRRSRKPVLAQAA
jgi:PEP-CTERM motif